MENLIKALREAPAPSRHIDADLALLLEPARYARSDSPGNHENGHMLELKDGKPFRMTTAPRYTTYLDEALRLAPSPSDNWAINTEPCGYYATITTVRAKREYDEMIESQWNVKTHAGQVTERARPQPWPSVSRRSMPVFPFNPSHRASRAWESCSRTLTGAVLKRNAAAKSTHPSRMEWVARSWQSSSGTALPNIL